MKDNIDTLFNLNEFGIRTTIDLIAVFILVGLIYYPKHRNKDFIFTFVLFNVINFMICFLLGSAKINMGFAFGLFAIFSIIKYRTIVVSIKDMGYFFVCVALGMLNSLANSNDNFIVIIICNLVILSLTFLLDRLDFINNENVKEIIYDNVELIKPNVREELIADLKERTGLEIHKVEIVSINYLKDIVLLKAFYYSKESQSALPTISDND
jgi:Ca2+/Na+ antiporter